MGKNELERPPFLTLWLENLVQISKSGKVYHLVPWWIIFFYFFATLIQRFIAFKFYTDPSVGIPIYAGILTLNGLLLTLAWNAFAKIFESICAPKFSTYLRANGIFKVYLYQISYVQAVQIIAVAVSAMALVALAIHNPVSGLNEWLFIATIATSCYALKEAAGAITVLHDLVWLRSAFDAHQEEKDNTAENVKQMAGRPR